MESLKKSDGVSNHVKSKLLIGFRFIFLSLLVLLQIEISNDCFFFAHPVQDTPASLGRPGHTAAAAAC